MSAHPDVIRRRTSQRMLAAIVTMALGIAAFVAQAPAAAAAGAFTVTRSPADITVSAGATATFSAAASGSPTRTVRWQKLAPGAASLVDIAGATACRRWTG